MLSTAIVRFHVTATEPAGLFIHHLTLLKTYSKRLQKARIIVANQTFFALCFSSGLARQLLHCIWALVTSEDVLKSNYYNALWEIFIYYWKGTLKSCLYTYSIQNSDFQDALQKISWSRFCLSISPSYLLIAWTEWLTGSPFQSSSDFCVGCEYFLNSSPS